MFRPVIYHAHKSHLRGLLQASKRALFATSSHDAILQKEESEGILTLTLNRPKQRNALNRLLLQELKSILTKLKDDPNDMSIRAVVVQANGPIFCSGHDLRELASTTTTESRQKLFRLCSDVMMLWKSVPQPTIAAVHGMATAAGCQLAAATDLTIASNDAKFMTPGVNIGLFCSTPAVPLVRCIPEKIAMDMLFTGRVLSAQEALLHGLVSRVIDSSPDDNGIEFVQNEARTLARSIASKSGVAMRIGKQALIEQSPLRSIEEAYDVATQAMVRGLASEDSDCGIASFLTKKSPDWKHR